MGRHRSGTGLANTKSTSAVEQTLAGVPHTEVLSFFLQPMTRKLRGLELINPATCSGSPLSHKHDTYITHHDETSLRLTSGNSLHTCRFWAQHAAAAPRCIIASIGGSLD